MRVAIAGDQFTIKLVESICSVLPFKEVVTENLGAGNRNKEITLQEIIPVVAKKVIDQEVTFGMLTCGAGVDVKLGTNRFVGLRATLCRDSGHAKCTKIYHDDTNILCLDSWYKDDFEQTLETWLNHKFGGDKDRVKMLQDFDVLS